MDCEFYHIANMIIIIQNMLVHKQFGMCLIILMLSLLGICYPGIGSAKLCKPYDTYSHGQYP